jgi:ribosomal protein S18 acetylase RimI-like enzyme
MSAVIVPFDKQKHNCAEFDCGNPKLNRYLKEQAGQDMRSHYASLFVTVEDGTGKVLGFYTLSSTSVSVDLLPIELQRKLPKYPYVPGIRIGRLAVDSTAQGQKLGTGLVANAIIRSISNVAEWALMEVDAKDEAAFVYWPQEFRPRSKV